MTNRVLHERLQQQGRHEAVHRRGLISPSRAGDAKAHSLDREVAGRGIQFLPQRDSCRCELLNAIRKRIAERKEHLLSGRRVAAQLMWRCVDGVEEKVRLQLGWSARKRA